MFVMLPTGCKQDVQIAASGLQIREDIPDGPDTHQPNRGRPSHGQTARRSAPPDALVAGTGGLYADGRHGAASDPAASLGGCVLPRGIGICNCWHSSHTPDERYFTVAGCTTPAPIDAEPRFQGVAEMYRCVVPHTDFVQTRAIDRTAPPSAISARSLIAGASHSSAHPSRKHTIAGSTSGRCPRRLTPRAEP